MNKLFLAVLRPTIPLVISIACLITGCQQDAAVNDREAKLLKALRDPNPRVRIEASSELVRMAPKWKELQDLILLLKDEKQQVRRNVCRALAEAHSRSIPLLAKNLKSKETLIRCGCAYAFRLMEANAAPATANLIDAMNDKDEEVRMHVIGALNFVPHTPSVVEAISRATLDGNMDVRTQAIEILDRLGPSAKVSVNNLITVTTTEKESLIRWNAARALYRVDRALGKKIAIPVLLAGLKRKSWVDRKTTAIILGELGDDAKVALPQLRALLNDEAPEVRDAAGQAISAIEGKSKVP